MFTVLSLIAPFTYIDTENKFIGWYVYSSFFDNSFSHIDTDLKFSGFVIFFIVKTCS